MRLRKRTWLILGLAFAVGVVVVSERSKFVLGEVLVSLGHRLQDPVERFDFKHAGDISPACASTSSRDPYCAMSCPAVLSPMPGTPGMLSDVSPFKPMKSGICSGVMP